MDARKLLESITSQRKLDAIRRLQKQGATPGELEAAADALKRMQRRLPPTLQPDWKRLYRGISSSAPTTPK